MKLLQIMLAEVISGRKLRNCIFTIFLLDAPANVFKNREIDKRLMGVLFKSYRDFEQFADKFPWVLIA